MYQGKRIAVVVPAYNEAGLVGQVIETLPSFVDRAYVVDDASTDETWADIRRAATRKNEITEPAALADGGVTGRAVVPMRHETNRGVGAAIKTGYLAAQEEGMDVVAVMGGDGQMDPAILHRIVEPVVDGRAEYAKGNRLRYPSDRVGMPTHRIVGNFVLTTLTRIASGYWTIGDPQNGYTAISRAAIAAADADEMYEFYGYCNDILVKLNVARARVADVPMTARYAEETSHIRLSTYVPRVSAMLARNFLWRLSKSYVSRARFGVSASYALGAIACLIGFVRFASAVPGRSTDCRKRREPERSRSKVVASAISTVLLGIGAMLVGVGLDRWWNRSLDFVVDDGRSHRTEE